MMKTSLCVGILSDSTTTYAEIEKSIPKNLARIIEIQDGNLKSPIEIAFLDCRSKRFKQILDALQPLGVYTVVVLPESFCSEEVPHLLQEGFVDDLLLTPIRPLEVLGKLNHVTYLARVRDLASVNASLKDMILKFEEDLKIARSIQKSMIPEKFPPVHGLSVRHKYISGFKSGGDYLDFYEFDDKNHVGILMTDSTGYGLSSALMTVILRLSLKLSKEEIVKPSVAVEQIFQELKLTMKPKETLSIFYGIFNRKTFELKFTGAGDIGFFRQSRFSGEKGKIEHMSMQNAPLSVSADIKLTDKKIKVEPEDRLVLFSDGFSDAYNSDDKEIMKFFEKTLKEDSMEIVNDFSYRLKKKLTDDDDMPEQDSSVMVIDVEKNVLRIA